MMRVLGLSQLGHGLGQLGRRGDERDGLGQADSFEHLVEGQLVDHALDRQLVLVALRADRLDQRDRRLLDRDLFVVHLAGDLLRILDARLLRHADGGDLGPELLLEDLRERHADRVELRQVFRRLGLRVEDVDLVPGGGGFLRLQLQLGQVQLAAIEGHRADHDRLPRLVTGRVERELMIEHRAGRVGELRPRGQHVGRLLRVGFLARLHLDADRAQPVIVARLDDDGRLRARGQAALAAGSTICTVGGASGVTLIRFTRGSGSVCSPSVNR